MGYCIIRVHPDKCRNGYVDLNCYSEESERETDVDLDRDGGREKHTDTDTDVDIDINVDADSDRAIDTSLTLRLISMS